MSHASPTEWSLVYFSIPKLAKEIKREKRDMDTRKKRKEMRMAIKRYERISKFPMSFQLPGELTPNLRKLRVRPYLLFS